MYARSSNAEVYLVFEPISIAEFQVELSWQEIFMTWSRGSMKFGWTWFVLSFALRAIFPLEASPRAPNITVIVIFEREKNYNWHSTAAMVNGHSTWHDLSWSGRQLMTCEYCEWTSDFHLFFLQLESSLHTFRKLVHSFNTWRLIVP